MAEAAERDAARRDAGRRRRAINDAKLRLRELRLELAGLNHLIGTRIALKDSDLDTLDVITRYGPQTPTVLARRMGVHVATLTGILNRLEAGGWITRSRLESDRRTVTVAGVPQRQAEIYRLYGGMNDALDAILGRYSQDELTVVVDFLRRTTEAGRKATDDLMQGD